ncbi:Dam family site-specific DNA-(adenine-N6)-methyltransferase [Heliophilum fasciatum]|uniref:Site-specific DNA-methyltransferase (adenine-specific) n=1 Tax=Heliophilum fasciatum TaxID=35700 RepID=A0A4R2RJT2_9FIRM|nr:Dam family site-specific DNA-(adenine-N6)-methyltransferase [Heliophilum fasciatum]MCW2278766.1 DNA adenine methylase [Heliophilum fasciatum]TCP62437.1 DNA adenine methylase [Heliophilum fasciatum]
MGELLRPFMKWPGNKYHILLPILTKLPLGRRLIEPFAGSCAVSLNAPFDRHVIGDINPVLIGLYRTLIRQPDQVIGDAQALFGPANNDAARYYELRDRFNQSTDAYERALLLIYLNRHGYNGLVRFNRKGKFNVPFGRYSRPYFPAKELHTFVERFAQADFRVLDFEDIEAIVEPGDVCYMDPPYLPLSSTSNFTGYATDGFSLAEQERLAHLARRLAARGIPVLLSNHDTPLARQLYAGAQIETIHVQRFISRDGQNRHKVGEVLALFSPADQ